MRYLLYASFFLLALSSCNKKIYREKQEITLTSPLTAADIRPAFEKELYRCVVDGKFGLKKFHMSGLLYFKNFSDTATRVLFQSELGSTFFDFGWDSKDSFRVYSIIDPMNKVALIKTLRKDFELLLVKNISKEPSGIYHFNNDPSKNFVRFGLNKGFVYYIVNKDRTLMGIENADEQRKVVVMKMTPADTVQRLPVALSINHLRAGFTIDLKKITRDDTAE
jgi:hypothetical protein